MSALCLLTAMATPTSPPLSVVMFPMDILENGLEANNFGMLGLGDVVIPGTLS